MLFTRRSCVYIAKFKFFVYSMFLQNGFTCGSFEYSNVFSVIDMNLAVAKPAFGSLFFRVHLSVHLGH